MAVDLMQYSAVAAPKMGSMRDWKPTVSTGPHQRQIRRMDITTTSTEADLLSIGKTNPICNLQNQTVRFTEKTIFYFPHFQSPIGIVQTVETQLCLKLVCRKTKPLRSVLPTKSPLAGSNARRGTQSFASTFALDCWPQTLKILEAAPGWGIGSSQMVIPSLAVVVAASRKNL